MKIALIHCPLGHKEFSENLRVVDEEFCLAPPIVLAYVAAILERAGHRVIIIDANVLKLSKEKTLKILTDFSPDMIGFRCDSYWFHTVVEWASYFKSRMETTVVAGGINITLYPRESLSYSCFDYGIVGEALESLPRLVSALERNEKPFPIKGLVYRQDGQVVVNPASEERIDFDDYPFPARHLLPNHRYSSFTSQRKNYTVMLTATGCPYQCSFCAISRLPYRERSVKSVIGEIQECTDKYGVREIDFFDATFFINKDRALGICEEILRRDIKIEWSCRSRVDVVDQDILKKASQAGCKRIYYGIESVSEEVLNNIHKNITREQIARAIAYSRACGIETLGFFMLGNPSDTEERILSAMRFAKEIRLDHVQVCRAIAKPNTGLNDRLIKTCGIDLWKEYMLDEKRFHRLPSPWTTLSQDDMDRLARKFYTSFYFRPSVLAQRVRRSKSAGELLRYAGVAAKWFFHRRQDGVQQSSGSSGRESSCGKMAAGQRRAGGVKKKILYIVTKLELGGAQKNALDLARHADRDLFDVFLFSAREGMLGPDAGAIRGLHVHRSRFLERPVHPLKDILALGEICSFIRRHRIDIVHTHSSKAGILGRWAAWLAGVRVVVHTVHGWSFHDQQSWLVRRFFELLERGTAKITDKIIVVSSRDQEVGLGRRIGSVSQFVLIPYGIDIGAFGAPRGREALRRELALNGDHLLIGSISCLKRQKAPEDFIRLAHLVKPLVPNAKFLLIGDGNLRKESVCLAKRLGLEEDVFFLGWRRDIPELLQAMDVFVLTSRWEGLPISVLEAMASARPVLVTDTGGVSDVVAEGRTGYLVRPGDMESMKVKLVALLLNPAKRHQLGEEARKGLGDRFSLQTMARSTYALYEET